MPRWPAHGKMRVITVALPGHCLKILAAFVERKVVPSRSEGIRLALSHGLPILEKMIMRQEQIIKESDVSTTVHTPEDTVFIPNGDGTYRQYLKVGEA